MVAEITAGNVVGENLEGPKAVRAATIVAKTDIMTLELTKFDYQNTVMAFKLVEANEISKFLGTMKYFRNWPGYKLSRLAHTAIIKNFSKGTVLYDMGSEAN